MASETKSNWTTEKITEAFIHHVLREGHPPRSEFAFAESLGMSEAEFYSFFTSFEALEQAIWTGLMEDTLNALEQDENFASFSAREKLLAFYFTHLEVMLKHRSYIRLRRKSLRQSPRVPHWLGGYKEKFLEFASGILAEGMEQMEVKDRPLIGSQYNKGLWVQLLFVLDFWCRDNSPEFEQTDAAIEKAVNLSFQLLGESALDSMIDFAKFLMQSR